MRKIGLIAGREFVAAVSSKGFVIGLLMMPALFALLAVASPRIMSAGSTRVTGEIAIVDPTGKVAGAVRQALTPEAVQERRGRAMSRAMTALGASSTQALREGPPPTPAIGPPPLLTLVERPADRDLQAAKAWLLESVPGQPRHAALVVVHANAVVPAAGKGDYGSYDLYLPANLDERVESEVRDALRDTIVGARTSARGLVMSDVRAMTTVAAPASVTVTGGAERQTPSAFNRSVPFIFAGLLVFGVMIGGQTLLTSTVEEKSSRVIEVLLSAVSPFELMAGKILGQMAVSLLVLALYVGMGVVVLMSFAMLGLVNPMLIVYLVIFFFITYLLFASVFGAIGAAVTEMREAQALLSPVMIVLMAPWMLAFPVSREPNSMLAVAMSFIPPTNSFFMMVRLASTSPPPGWQVWVTIVIGLASALAATWVAAKIFKVGLLMYGKPPNFATLVRWARQA
jgi:ABC-2 type transport system permease protein